MKHQHPNALTMQTSTITATELSRHTREILNRVKTGGETLAVERNGVPLARILPPEPSMTAAQALADWKPMLTEEDAEAWLQDSQGDFDPSVRDPWE
jgi:prevent-host-death family protein